MHQAVTTLVTNGSSADQTPGEHRRVMSQGRIRPGTTTKATMLITHQ
jgi:hypothetical protein